MLGATNPEITLVTFDREAFGKADFFLGPAMLEKVNENAESIRQRLGRRATLPMPNNVLIAKPALEEK